jgi:general secretion pathway protein J
MSGTENQRGFTLLELLIAITILGLIVVALTSGLRFAGQAWRAQERRSESQGDVDAVQNVLRQIIGSARRVNGDGVALRFVATLPDALARGGLYDVEISRLEQHLVLAWKPHFRGPASAATWQSARLVEDVNGLDFAYFVDTSGWQRVAQDRNRSPVLVRIALQLGDGRVWPPLIVAPMIEARSAVTN